MPVTKIATPSIAAAATDPREFLTVRDVAARLGYSPQMIRTLVHHGELQCLRVGRTYRFHEIWIAQFIERHSR